MIYWFANLPLVEKIGWSFLSFVFLGFVFLIFSFGLNRILGWRKLKDLEAKDRVGLKLEIIKTTAQILGGAFFLFGLYFTWQNLVVTQEKNRADLAMAQEKQITDLYVKAIEQLGSDKLEVRLGGIYALERIARDSDKDHGPIMEVLTAYVREKSPWLHSAPVAITQGQPKKMEEEKYPGEKIQFRKEKAVRTVTGTYLNLKSIKIHKKKTRLRTDIQAILTVIGRLGPAYDNEDEIQRLVLDKTDLRGAHLWNAHLEGASFIGAHLEGAYLAQAHLEGA